MWVARAMNAWEFCHAHYHCTSLISRLRRIIFGIIFRHFQFQVRNDSLPPTPCNKKLLGLSSPGVGHNRDETQLRHCQAQFIGSNQALPKMRHERVFTALSAGRKRGREVQRSGVESVGVK